MSTMDPDSKPFDTSMDTSANVDADDDSGKQTLENNIVSLLINTILLCGNHRLILVVNSHEVDVPLSALAVPGEQDSRLRVHPCFVGEAHVVLATMRQGSDTVEIYDLEAREGHESEIADLLQSLYPDLAVKYHDPTSTQTSNHDVGLYAVTVAASLAADKRIRIDFPDVFRWIWRNLYSKLTGLDQRFDDKELWLHPFTSFTDWANQFKEDIDEQDLGRSMEFSMVTSSMANISMTTYSEERQTWGQKCLSEVRNYTDELEGRRSVLCHAAEVISALIVGIQRLGDSCAWQEEISATIGHIGELAGLNDQADQLSDDADRETICAILELRMAEKWKAIVEALREASTRASQDKFWPVPKRKGYIVMASQCETIKTHLQAIHQDIEAKSETFERAKKEFSDFLVRSSTDPISTT